MNCKDILYSFIMDGSLRMLTLWLLLGSRVCTGFSDNPYEVETYGSTHKIRMLRASHYVLFKHFESSNVTILWQRDRPQSAVHSRLSVIGKYFVIKDLTQRDGGQYVIKDKDGEIILMKTIEVQAHRQEFTLSPGDSFEVTYDMDPKNCNIYFEPIRETEILIVRQGRWHQTLYNCLEFDILKPCGIFYNSTIKMSCNGFFIVRDNNDDEALVVKLTVESSYFDPIYLAYAGGAVAAVVLLCCLCCCCKRSKQRRSKSAAAAASTADEPSVCYYRYDQEPARRMTNQLSPASGTQYPSQPASAPTAPLIHEPPTVDEPPAYSHVSGQAEPADAPTVPIFSSPDLKFEPKGMTFASPLSTDSGSSDVYSSDKLNFHWKS